MVAGWFAPSDDGHVFLLSPSSGGSTMMKVAVSAAASSLAKRASYRLIRPLFASTSPPRDVRWESRFLRLDDALELFDGLLHSNPAPPTHTFNDLFTKMKKSGNHKMIFALYQTMVQEVKVSPDSFTYSILIDCCRHIGGVDLDFAFLADMFKRNCQPDTVILSGLLNGLCDVKRIGDAVKLFKRMPVMGCTPDVVTYCTLMNLCCIMDKVGLGSGLFGDMLKHGYLPNTAVLNALINGLSRSKMFIDVGRAFIRMTEIGCPPDVITYNTVINCCCQMEQIDHAFAVFAIMLKEGCCPSTATFTTMINGLFLAGRVYDAEMLFRRVSELGLADVLTYGVLINGYCQIKMVDLAFKVLGTMLKQGYQPSEVIISELINGMCMSDRIADAAALVERMPAMGYSVDVVIYSTLIKGLCCMNNTKMAIELLNKMTRFTDSCKPDVITYNTIISHLCKEGDMNGANKLFEEMNANGIVPTYITFKSLITGYCVQGKWNDASNLYEKMVQNGIYRSAPS